MKQHRISRKLSASRRSDLNSLLRRGTLWELAQFRELLLWARVRLRRAWRNWVGVGLLAPRVKRLAGRSLGARDVLLLAELHSRTGSGFENISRLELRSGTAQELYLLLSLVFAESWEQAAEALNKFLRTQPSTRNVAYLLNVLNRAGNDFLRYLCNHYIFSKDFDHAHLREAAKNLARDGHESDAIALLEAAIDSGTRELSLLKNLVYLLRKVGRVEEEVKYLALTLVHYPGNVWATNRKYQLEASSPHSVYSEQSGSSSLIRQETLREVGHRLGVALPITSNSWFRRKRKRRPARRVLVVSRNWNFLDDLIDWCGQNTRIEIRTLDLSLLDFHRMRRPHEVPERFQELISWCDTVFCDWVNQDAVWVVANTPKSKTVFLRLHSYELMNKWPLEISWGRVSALLSVSGHNLTLLREAVDLDSFGCAYHVLPNLRNFGSISSAKTNEAEFTIALVGYNSRNKDPLMALRILKGLRESDPRWRIFLVGNPIEDPQKVFGSTYAKEFSNLAADLSSEGALVLVDWVDDISETLNEVGFILSCSLREGTHEAVREGIASGAVPVVRDWPWGKKYRGASTQFPDSFVFEQVEEAVTYIREISTSDNRVKEAATQKRALLEREGIDVLGNRLCRILGAPHE